MAKVFILERVGMLANEVPAFGGCQSKTWLRTR